MGNLAVIAARCPHYKQRNAIEYPDALKPVLKIGFPPVFAGQQVAVKKTIKTGEVNAMIPEIARSLGLIPRDHGRVYI